MGRAKLAIDVTAAVVRDRMSASYQTLVAETFGSGSSFSRLEAVEPNSAETAAILGTAIVCAHVNNPQRVPNINLCPQKILERGTDAKPSCVVGYNDRDHTIYVVFRGTKTTEDVLTDINFAPVPVGDTGISVPAGMLSRVQDLIDDVIAAVWEISGILAPREENRAEACSLCLCGHSLGGGLAMSTALLLLVKDAGRDILNGLFGGCWSVMTFGAPLCLALETDVNPLLEDVPELFFTLSKHSTHVVHQFDPVPRLLGREGAVDFTIITWSSR